MGELAEEQARLEKLPAWVTEYLAAWGSRFDPDGKPMRVKTAAALAGTTASNVRDLRRTSEQFRLLERIARHGGAMFLASYMEAGIRSLAPAMLRAFAALIEAENPQVVLQGMKWALDKPDMANLNVNLEGETRLVVNWDDANGTD